MVTQKCCHMVFHALSKHCVSYASGANGLNWVAPFGGNCCAVETTNASYASHEPYYEPYYALSS